MATTIATAQDLWKRAVDSVGPHVLQGLHPAKTGMRDIVNATLKVAEAKREVSIKKRWRIARRSKEDVIVRDVMEKIIHWIRRFKEVGDNAVPFDPGHAALPWAAIRFILQATINYAEVEREILRASILSHGFSPASARWRAFTSDLVLQWSLKMPSWAPMPRFWRILLKLSSFSLSRKRHEVSKRHFV